MKLHASAGFPAPLSTNNKYAEVITSIKKIPEVVECHFITGKASILLKLFCFDNNHLMEILLNTIQKIPYVQSTETMISLDQAFERQIWVKDYNYSTEGLSPASE